MSQYRSTSSPGKVLTYDEYYGGGNSGNAGYGDYEKQPQGEVENLTQHLSSQIEYNNNLLQQLQEIEHKLQEKSRIMNEKDQELRKVKKELTQLLTTSSSEMENLERENLDKLRSYYQFLGNIQHEVKQWGIRVSSNDDNCVKVLSDIEDLQKEARKMLNAENSNADKIFNDMRLLEEEKQKLKNENEKGMDTIQSLEVMLEEERAKTIMLQEKSSKLDQQVREVERRADNAEKAIEERYQVEIENLRMELNSLKSQYVSNQEELRSTKHQLQQSKQLKKESDDSAKQLQNQVRMLTESLKKMQRQLDESRNLYNIVQEERATLSTECESMRKELHQVLQQNAVNAANNSPRAFNFANSNKGKIVSAPSSAPPSGAYRSNSNKPSPAKEDDMDDIVLRNKKLQEKFLSLQDYKSQLKQNLDNAK